MFQNYLIFFVTLILYLANLQSSHADKACKFNLKNNLHGKNSPIILSLDKSGSNPEYLYPTLEDPENIRLPTDQKLKIFCPGKTNRKSTEVVEPGALLLSSTKLILTRSIESINCSQNGKVKVGNDADANKNNVVNFTNIHCEDITEGAILRKINEKCGNGERYEIGYDLGDDNFLKTIDLCHDESEAKTLWAHAVLVPVNQEAYRNRESGSKSFKTGQLYQGLHMASKGPYDLVNQFQSMLRLVDDDENQAKKYSSVLTKDRKYLAKGHLIARADKFYKREQDSTYFYANVVPMWQQINAQPGNWYFVEEYLRNLAFQKESKLDVWAGGIGTLEMLDDSTRKRRPEHDYYLVLDDKIPVPQILFKCAVDKENEEGLCFLVVNNPYIRKTQIEKSGDQYIVCEKYNTCEEINPNHDKANLGYFYCCRLGDFYETFQDELGLDDLEEFKDFKEMTLFTNE